MSMYKHNFSHLLLAGWTLGKLAPYPTNPKEPIHLAMCEPIHLALRKLQDPPNFNN